MCERGWHYCSAGLRERTRGKVSDASGSPAHTVSAAGCQAALSHCWTFPAGPACATWLRPSCPIRSPHRLPPPLWPSSLQEAVPGPSGIEEPLAFFPLTGGSTASLLLPTYNGSLSGAPLPGWVPDPMFGSVVNCSRVSARAGSAAKGPSLSHACEQARHDHMVASRSASTLCLPGRPGGLISVSVTCTCTLAAPLAAVLALSVPSPPRGRAQLLHLVCAPPAITLPRRQPRTLSCWTQSPTPPRAPLPSICGCAACRGPG